MIALGYHNFAGIVERNTANMFYQDSFLFYQKPHCMQNNFLLPPTPQYSSHLLDEGRICSPSQPCFIAKQTNAFSHPGEPLASSTAPRLSFNYGAPRSLLPTSSGKIEIPETPNSEIMHPLPVYFRVKPTLRTPSGKRCRKSRTVFTELQLRLLEKAFSEQRYLDSTNRANLSRILGLNEAQVKTWFQNRRMKWKKRLASSRDKPDSSTKNTEQGQGKDNKEKEDNNHIENTEEK